MYEKLKQDPQIKLWFDNHTKKITAQGDLRRLGLFCEMFNVTPQGIAKMGQPPEGSPLKAKMWMIEKVVILQDEKHRFKGNYVANFVKSLVSWLGQNGITLPDKPELHIKGRGKNKKYQGEEPPAPEELQHLLAVSDLRQQVAISLIAFSGFRPRTLGNHDGSDGLRIRDFPEMHVDFSERKVTFEGKDEKGRKILAIPTRIVVREEINKGEDRGYQTFLNQQGCDSLKIYLEDRMTPKKHRVYDEDGRPVIDETTKKQKEELRAEKLTPDSPIIAHNHPYRLSYQTIGDIRYFTETFVPAQNISYAIISPVFKRLGLKQPNGDDNRPYVLRGFFDDRLMMAESDKKIGVIFSWRQAWMGHSEGIEAVYTTNKGIPKDVIEQMREAYRQASDLYLTPPKRNIVDKEQVMAEFRRESLVMKGWTDEEIDKLGDLTKYTAQEMQRFGEMRTHEQPSETQPTNRNNPIEILKFRLASGEIGDKEFMKLKALIQT